MKFVPSFILLLQICNWITFINSVLKRHWSGNGRQEGWEVGGWKLSYFNFVPFLYMHHNAVFNYMSCFFSRREEFKLNSRSVHFQKSNSHRTQKSYLPQHLYDWQQKDASVELEDGGQGEPWEMLTHGRRYQLLRGPSSLRWDVAGYQEAMWSMTVPHRPVSTASAASFHPWTCVWTLSRRSPYKHLTWWEMLAGPPPKLIASIALLAELLR